MNTQNSEQQVKHGIFPFGEKNERYADVFVGQSYLAGLAAAPDASATVAHVSFEPACRNNWHIHTDGYQILLVTGGEGSLKTSKWREIRFACFQAALVCIPAPTAQSNSPHPADAVARKSSPKTR